MKVFMIAFWTVAVAELACGVRTAVLASIYQKPFAVFLGTMVGTAAIMLPAVVIGRELDYPQLRYIGGVFFVVYGLLVLVGKA